MGNRDKAHIIYCERTLGILFDRLSQKDKALMEIRDLLDPRISRPNLPKVRNIVTQALK